MFDSTDNHFIRIERSETNKAANRADVVMQGQFLTDGGTDLYFLGDGRFDLSANLSADFDTERFLIHGAELRLTGNGKVEIVPIYELKHGGALILDNIGTHNSAADGTVIEDRLAAGASIDLGGGGQLSLLKNFDGGAILFQQLGRLSVSAGANILGGASRDAAGAFFLTKNFTRNTDWRSTLHIPDKSETGYFLGITNNPTDFMIGGIIPWLTIGDRWGQITVAGGATGLNYYLSNHSNNGGWNYATDTNPNTWATTANVYVGYETQGGATAAIAANKTINSLILNGTLNLNGKNLTISSGGLLSTQYGNFPTNNSVITSSTAARIQTSNNRPLYIHTYGNRLNIEGQVAISLINRSFAVTDLIKTGPGELRLAINATHSMGRLYIHEGTVNLAAGYMMLSFASEIVVGDGAGTDVLQLRGNVRDQLYTNVAGTFPKITLHGTPYDPRGPEYGGDQAILRLGGNTKQHLRELHIQDRGTIDWVGGEVSKANILYLDKLTFSGPDSILFMHNWYEYEDMLLVKKGWFNGLTGAEQAKLLSQVWFEGYENFPVIHRNFDANYYQITPFGLGAPEPATYGAILGAVGIGIWTWRKRKRQKRAANESRVKS